MKKLLLILLTLSLLLTSCELMTEEVKPTVKLVTVALDYEKSYIGHLPNTIHDQTDITSQIKLLCDKSGYKFETYTLTETYNEFIYNGSIIHDNDGYTPSQTLKHEIDKLFTETLPSNSKAEDITIFFYSGHGDSDGTMLVGLEKTIDFEKPDKDQVELIFNGIVKNNNNRFTIAQLHDHITPLKGKKLIILDSCFSGKVVENTANAIAPNELLEKGFEKLFSQEKIDNRNTWYITAASSEEKSEEVESVGHGIFTYYLLQGLGFDTVNNMATNNAPLGSDKEISLNELYHYVEKRVSKDFAQHTQKGMSILDLVLFKWD